ncbi:MAG TPA: LysR family transcriptional regulator [Paenalcaligenes sp.]|nr:LysR family transcriptional regulator [Paenalcaligenes sp.]
MKKLPDFEAWAIFATVANEGSFAQAAQRLGLSQATVSKAIARLEERSDSTLFHRTSRQMTLTNTGEAVLEQAQALLDQGAEIESEIAEQVGQLSGVVRVSAPMSFGVSSLAPLLPAFMERHPEVELNIHFDDSFVDIVAERFDLALRISRLEDSTLLARHCCEIRTVLVAAPTYVERFGLLKHPKDLLTHRILMYVYHRRGMQWHFMHPEKGRYVQALPEPVMRVNNANGMLPALRAGLGVTMLPEFLVADDLRTGALVPVLGDWQAEPADLYIVMPPGRRRPARVNALIEYLVAQLREEPWQIN